MYIVSISTHALLVTQCKHMHTNINSFPMKCIILVAVPLLQLPTVIISSYIY